jgi:MFS family permease
LNERATAIQVRVPYTQIAADSTFNMVLPGIFSRRINGAPAFLLIIATQCLSIIASQMSGFAVAVWAYESTGQVLAGGIATSIHMLLTIVFSPFAGVLIDRYNRKKLLIVGDALSVLGALGLLFMALSGNLQIWHLYVEAVLVGIGQAIQQPAYAAVIGSLVDKSNLNRANGLMSLVDWAPRLVAPVLGGMAYGLIGIEGILSLDVLTFAIAIAAFAVVAMPGYVKEQRDEAPSMWREMREGAAYIFSRASFRTLVLIGLLLDVCIGLIYALQAPLVLARTTNDSAVLGLVLSLGGFGGLLAAAVLTFWKDVRDQMLISVALIVIWGVMRALFSLADHVALWAVALFLANATGQIGMTLQRSIWQAKVPPAFQGRVFALKRTLTWLSSPFTPLIAAVLADRWLEPLLRSDGAAQLPVARLVGTGAGSGIALIMLVASFGMVLAGALMAACRSSRQVETLIPDHDQDAQTLERTP